MKIAMIGQKGIPARSGGVERHVEEIAQRLVKLGHSVTVYCRKHYVTVPTTEYKAVKIKIIPTVNTASLDAITYTFLATLDALRSDYDVIHYHALGPASFSWLPTMMGKKTIVSVHGLDWQRGKWGNFAKAYLKLGEKIAAKFPDKCVLVSEALLGYFANTYGNPQKYVVIPNGVTPQEPLKPHEIDKLGLSQNAYILFLARLVPEKGCHYLIKAFKTLKTNKKLVIAGSSSHTDAYEHALHQLAEDDSRIMFLGAVGGDLLNELYTNAYLYVLPSEIEGMPLTLLESLSYGTFPIVSDIPENKIVVKDQFGRSFGNKDIESLREVLNYCLSNPDYIDNVSARCRDYVLSEYNWDKAAQALEALYTSVVKGGRACEH